MKTRSTLLLLAFAVAASIGHAQSPNAPVVVQAITTAQPTVRVVPTAMPDPNASAALLRSLSVMQAANEEILKKQAATLQQLEELEKAAEQVKIYSKRG